MALPRIQLEQTALLVIDMQQKLLPTIEGADRVLGQVVRLIRGCGVLGVPVLVTEQYPKGLGATAPEVLAALPAQTLIEPKMKFSACIEAVRKRLSETGRTTVLVCGIETHVCVMQTTLDLIEAGFLTAVVGDAVGSRRPIDTALGLQRITAAGALAVSVEMALLEMVREAGTERFKAVLPELKERGQRSEVSGQ